jgi:sRNA-binding regulator protein Hfq
MTKQEINVQDGFLFQCLKNKLNLNVELITGRSLEGRLVYKHAIATLYAIESPD